jgi:hypothetical protein
MKHALRLRGLRLALALVASGMGRLGLCYWATFSSKSLHGG